MKSIWKKREIKPKKLENQEKYRLCVFEPCELARKCNASGIISELLMETKENNRGDDGKEEMKLYFKKI